MSLTRLEREHEAAFAALEGAHAHVVAVARAAALLAAGLPFAADAARVRSLQERIADAINEEFYEELRELEREVERTGADLAAAERRADDRDYWAAVMPGAW